MATRTAASLKTNRTLKTTKGLVKKKRNIIIFSIAAVACVGAALFFFANAATNNCQKENKVDICDVDQTAGGSDTVLSTTGEAESLGGQGWGVYYGAAFRAPTTAYNGAVPVHRTFNTGATWHDYVTDTQKSEKEAKYGAQKDEGVAFFAWTAAGQPGTVPIYRITRGGAATQAMFSADKAWVDKMIALDVNNSDGWKTGTLMQSVAFYAYPSNYKVAGEANPYDCAVYENFISSRCATAAKTIVTAIDNGSIPKTTACPTDLTTYLKNPLSTAYTADCQKFWNAKASDCSLAENFVSDRCKAARDALAASQKVQIQQRAAAATPSKKTTNTKKTTTKTTAKTTTPASTATATDKCGTNSAGQKGIYNTAADVCKYPAPSQNCPANSAGKTGIYESTTNTCKYPPTPAPARKSCDIKFNSPNNWLHSKSSEGISPFINMTLEECNKQYKYEVNKGWRWNIREYWDGKLINSTPDVRPK